MFKSSLVFWVFLICASSFSQTVQPLPEKEFSGSQTQKWSEVQNELGQLKAKVDAQTLLVKELLKSKKGHESKMSADDIGKLKKEHSKLQSLTVDYNEKLSDFQFRFPEKGLESGRKYIRLENQTLEQMEKSPTLEGRLKKLQKKIKKQYQAEDSAAVDPKKLPTYKPIKVPVGSKGLDSVKPADTDVTDQINLVK